MKVKILKNTAVNGKHLEAGSTVEVSIADARALFESRKAVPTDGREEIKITEAATFSNRDPKPARKGK